MTALNFRSRPKINIPSYGKEYMVDNDLLPWQHLITAWIIPELISGAFAGYALSYLWPFGVVAWSSTDGTEYGYRVSVAAGVWKVVWITDTRADYGILRPYIDGAWQQSLSWDNYRNGTNSAVAVQRSFNVTLTRGEHLFSIKCSGKNAAATGYLMTVSGFGLVRQS